MQAKTTFDAISKTLKNCDLSDTYCDQCPYKEYAPNKCIQELHTNAFYLLRDTKELADDFYHSIMDKAQKEG